MKQVAVAHQERDDNTENYYLGNNLGNDVLLRGTGKPRAWLRPLNHQW